MKILVVDDEYYIVRNIVDNISWDSLGIDKVYSAYSAAQARKVMEKEDIDLLITDIEMPQEDGLSLIRWARDRSLLPLPIVLTGHQRFDYAQTAVNLHIFAYTVKPVNIDELEETLRAAKKMAGQLKMLEQSDAQSDAKEEAREESSDPVEKIKKYVAAHLSDQGMNREQIASYVHMNEDYMSHIFSTRTGGSLSNYIQEVRIAEAKRLLRTEALSMVEISERTGFSSTSYFHRQFKKSTGMTPQNYREKQLLEKE